LAALLGKSQAKEGGLGKKQEKAKGGGGNEEEGTASLPAKNAKNGSTEPL